MKAFALCLLLAAPVFAQEVEYDKFKDMSTVYYRSGYIGESKGGRRARFVQLTAWFTFPGQKLGTVPDKFTLRFQTVVYGSWLWLNERRLLLIVDGDRLNLGEGQRTSEGGRVESVFFRVDRETLTKIADAGKVEMQVGPFESEIGEKQRAGIKKVLDYKQ